jgi:hypothetical protein
MAPFSDFKDVCDNLIDKELIQNNMVGAITGVIVAVGAGALLAHGSLPFVIAAKIKAVSMSALSPITSIFTGTKIGAFCSNLCSQIVTQIGNHIETIAAAK